METGTWVSAAIFNPRGWLRGRMAYRNDLVSLILPRPFFKVWLSPARRRRSNVQIDRPSLLLSSQCLLGWGFEVSEASYPRRATLHFDDDLEAFNQLPIPVANGDFRDVGLFRDLPLRPPLIHED